MDRESYDKLPYEKQDKIERLCLKNTYLGFTHRETSKGEVVTMSVIPMYKSPLGEVRYYNSGLSQTDALGKHLFEDLTFMGTVSDWGGSYAWNWEYRNVSSVNQHQAQMMNNTLKWLERKMSETSEWLWDKTYQTYAEFIRTVAFSVGAVGGLKFVESTRSYEEMTVDQLIDHIDEIESGYVTKFAEAREERDAAQGVGELSNA